PAPAPEPRRSPTGTARSGPSRPEGSSPTGTPRAGRREIARPRVEQPQSVFARLRTPILAVIVVVVLAGVGIVAFTTAAAPAYACGTVDTVRPAASGELGQIQQDQGNQHVQPGDHITYPVCPPASGKHILKTGFGPLQPKVYGPEDQGAPNGWVHNLEHGGLVLLYSCDKGACDDAGQQALRDFATGFPNSPICALPAGTVGPVEARFEQMPARYAALVWDRVLYLDNLDTATVYDFYGRYGERVVDGKFVSPPEPQCPIPSPSASAGASVEPSPSGS
ncbi:MAG: DUF3105 domain-containing protein, partial [Chloroflexota bacterium]